MNDGLLIYGAYGYTGRLIVEEALRHGLRPTLAGRNEKALREMARDSGLAAEVFALDDPEVARHAVERHELVLNCAGPFRETAQPMADACLATGVHYLDITGEIAVFEALAARDNDAKRATVMLLPGTGFDVVPTDCLAAHLKQRLPAADRLRLAFSGGGGMSRGTLMTTIDKLGEPGAIRRDGRIVPVPPAFEVRDIDFGRGPRRTVTIPWGDVSTAFHTTGIPDIRVYTAVKPGAVKWMRLSRHLGWLLRRESVRNLLRHRVDRGRPGPDPGRREASRSLVWGEALAPDGMRAAARMQGPNGYSFTAVSAVAIARRVLEGAARPGFQTPAGLFGADFALELGFTREDLA